jgi:flavodoxin
MNTLVLYDSRFGHTEHLAMEIAEKFKEHGKAEIMRVHTLGVEDMRDTDLLVLGAPSHNRGLTPAMEEFLANVPPSALLGKHVAVFDTRNKAPWVVAGSAAHRLARRVKGLGAKLVVSPKSFFLTRDDGPLTDGEDLEADDWAHVVVEKARNIN